MTMRLRTDPDLPHERRPDCPEELSEVVMKALARDPQARYQTSNEMIGDLMGLFENQDGKKIYDPILNPKFAVGVETSETPKTKPEIVSDAEMALVGRAPSPLEQTTTRNSVVAQPSGGGVQEVFSSGVGDVSSDTTHIVNPDLEGTVMLDSSSVDLLKASRGITDNVDEGVRSQLADVVEGRKDGAEGSDDYEPEPVYPRSYEPLVDVLPKPQSIAELSRKASEDPSSLTVDDNSLSDLSLIHI